MMSSTALLGLLLMATPAVWADKGRGIGSPDRPGSPDRDNTLNLAILRIADFGAGEVGPFPGSNGTDPLLRGEVSVDPDRDVTLLLAGAKPNTTYEVQFCRFVFACVALTPPSVTTNAGGAVEARLKLPGSQTLWAGMFLLKSGGLNQFVSGFRIQPAPVGVTGVEVDLRGRIASLSPLRLVGLNLDIVVNSSTKFEKVDSLGDLKVGQTVEIKGVTMGSAILATRVRLMDDDD